MAGILGILLILNVVIGLGMLAIGDYPMAAFNGLAAICLWLTLRFKKGDED